jgi:penicillin-binding protein 1A
MLADVINSGTGWKARQIGFELPAAGKTGTTNDYHDAWFVGFTPSLVSGVWVGYDQPQPILPGSAYAGDVAVPLWARFMKGATASDKPAWFRAPPDITTAQICRLSGKRPAGGCGSAHVSLDDGTTAERSTIVTEYFVRGTEPTETCHLHVGRSLFARMAGFFSAPAAPARTPVKIDEPAPAPTVARAEPEAHRAAEPPAPQKKRGFWSRLFGKKDKANDREDKKNQRK